MTIITWNRKSIKSGTFLLWNWSLFVLCLLLTLFCYCAAQSNVVKISSHVSKRIKIVSSAPRRSCLFPWRLTPPALYILVCLACFHLPLVSCCIKWIRDEAGTLPKLKVESWKLPLEVLCLMLSIEWLTQMVSILARVQWSCSHVDLAAFFKMHLFFCIMTAQINKYPHLLQGLVSQTTVKIWIQ